MAMNVGGGYPMIGGMNGMNGGMMGGSSSSENVIQYYTQKYGCEDCFRTEPYWREYPKPVTKVPEGSLKPSFLSRLWRNICGG